MERLEKTACDHRKTVTVDADMVCPDCGVVVGTSEDSRSGIYENTKSTASLYELKSVGSLEDVPKIPENDRLRKYFRGPMVRKGPKRYISQFSNTLEKLRMRGAVKDHAWSLFSKNIGGKRAAETACWAIFAACMKMGTPILDEEIRNAVMMCFSRNRMAGMVGIRYHNMSSTPPKSDKNTKKYYFDTQFRRILSGRTFTEKDMAIKKEIAWRLYTEIYTEGSQNANAKLAIKEVFGV